MTLLGSGIYCDEMFLRVLVPNGINGNIGMLFPEENDAHYLLTEIMGYPHILSSLLDVSHAVKY